jgi:hypothetical protein
MAFDLSSGVVGVLKPDRTTVAGTGFVVASDGLIATCAHVVQYAGAGPGDTVDLIFHATSERRVAKVVPEYWRAPDAWDVAVLRLEGSVPDGAYSLLLGEAAEAYQHHFSTYGFPPSLDEVGMWGDGTISNFVHHPTAGPMLQLRTTDVTAGFSGAPVLDIQTGRVVGMVSEITAPDQYKRLAETAFATSARTLLDVCSALQLSQVCPYRSLDTFTQDDAEFFFGRENMVRKLLNKLQREPSFLAVLGPSGSGKSSLIQAGLLPQLRAGRIPGSESWGVVSIRQYDDPFEELVAAGLTNASAGLVDGVKAWLIDRPECERLMLVMDQFEELFVSCPEPLRQTFVKQVTKLLDSPSEITIVITMQDAFYSHFAHQAPELAQEWLSGGSLVQITDLSKDELVDIVQKPAERVGLAFEDGLVEAIVNDALATISPEEAEDTARSTVLPLVEFALAQLWERRQDGTLSRKAYDEIGGLTGRLTLWADRAYRALGAHDDRLQSYARRIFTDLVRLGDEGEKNVHGRRRSFAELYQNEPESEMIQQVIRQLTEARLLVTTDNIPPSGDESVEVINDALVRKWGRLHNWLREEKQNFEKWRREIRPQAQDWLDSYPEDPERRDENKLLRGRELDQAESWVRRYGDNLTELEREFLSTSRYTRKRNAKLNSAEESSLPLIDVGVSNHEREGGGSWSSPARPDSLPGRITPRPKSLPGKASPRPDSLPGNIG